MLKAIFGFLGLLMVVAIVRSLVENPPDAIQRTWQSGQVTTHVKDPSAQQQVQGEKKSVYTHSSQPRRYENAKP